MKPLRLLAFHLMAWLLKMAGSLPQVPRCMAADGWRYGQGQGLHGSLVRSILEPTIRGEPFPLWK
jgi:hypothetical protein